MVDWLAFWGVSSAVGFAFDTALEELAHGGLEAFIDDCFAGSPPPSLSGHEAAALATGKALTQLLELVQQELEDAGAEAEELASYCDPVTRFARRPEVRRTLGESLRQEAPSASEVWTGVWDELAVSLPDEFNWQRVAKRYERKARALRRESAARPVLHLNRIQEQPGAPAHEPGTDEPAPRYLDWERYQLWIRKLYGKLPLHDVDPTRNYDLDLRQVFVPPRLQEWEESPPQLRELPPQQRHELEAQGELSLDSPWGAAGSMEERPVARSALEVCLDTRRSSVLILGDPGTGKSTLLRYLALAWAHLPPAERLEHPVPFLIELGSRGAGSGGDLLEFLQHGAAHHLDPRQVVERLDQPGGAVVLLDGLDEAAEASVRQELPDTVVRLRRRYPDTRFIATCRLLGSQVRRLKDEGFELFWLQEFDDSQIEEFLRHWHTLTIDEPWERDTKRERLMRVIEDWGALNELVKTPLLLSLIAFFNRRRELPRDLSELYNDASRILLRSWDVEPEPQASGSVSLHSTNKQALLQVVAQHVMTQEPGRQGNLIEEAELEEILTDHLRRIDLPQPEQAARSLCRRLRSRNSVLCFKGAERYAFLHPAFLDHFCAAALTPRPGVPDTPSEAEFVQQVFAPHWREEAWHGILSLVAHHLPTHLARSALEFLLEQEDPAYPSENLLLATRCLAGVHDRRPLTRASAALRDRVSRLIDYDLDYFYDPRDTDAIRRVRFVRTQAVKARAATWSGDPETRTWLEDLVLSNDDADVQATALRELARSYREDPTVRVFLLGFADLTEHSLLRAIAIGELVRGFRQDPETRALVRTESHGDSLVNVVAVEALARGYREDPETPALLKRWAENHDDPNVRVTAVQELGLGFQDDPEMPELLKGWARFDEDSDVRIAALQELSRGFGEDPEVLTLLRDWVDCDDDSYVRVAAVEELARRYREDPETLLRLKGWAETHTDSYVRRVAITELVRGFKRDPEVLPRLRSWAQSDENSYVRRIAVKELVRGFGQDPETLPLVRAWAESDASPIVRCGAVAELAENLRDDPSVLSLLVSRARLDEDPVVRRVVVEELAQNFTRQPEVLPLLATRAEEDVDAIVREAALEALVEHWDDDPATLPLLLDRAQVDEVSVVRRAAVRGLARNFKHDVHTLPLLQKCAQADPHPFVRVAALEGLARGFRDDPATLSTMQTRATTDEDAGVRGAALRELVRGFKEDPETVEILKQRALADEDPEVREAAFQELAWAFREDPAVRQFLERAR